MFFKRRKKKKKSPANVIWPEKMGEITDHDEKLVEETRSTSLTDPIVEKTKHTSIDKEAKGCWFTSLTVNPSPKGTSDQETDDIYRVTETKHIKAVLKIVEHLRFDIIGMRRQVEFLETKIEYLQKEKDHVETEKDNAKDTE